jgi:predicted porin
LNNGNSRFGLKGVEDLGGGMKAGFNFEGGINIYWWLAKRRWRRSTGCELWRGGQLFSRAANVYLQGGFGR